MTELDRRLPKGRAQLVKVLATSGDVIQIEDVAAALNLSRASAAQRLSRWTEQGWLSRVGQGNYVPASLDTMGAERVLDDPWVLVPALYAPAYIGGRTAAEHWDLTEQIFNDIVVLTVQPIRERRQVRHGAIFTLKQIDERKLFGTKAVWRHNSRVAVSDLHRTILDMLDDPSLGGGLQHTADCLEVYLRRNDRDDAKLIEYADRLGNGAVFKRLGFLSERYLGAEAPLASICIQRLSGGYAKLDPAIESTQSISKWRLRVPQTWARTADR